MAYTKKRRRTQSRKKRINPMIRLIRNVLVVSVIILAALGVKTWSGWDLHIPGFHIPGFHILGFDVPDFDIPDFDVPDLDLPDIDIPDINIPGISLPGRQNSEDLDIPDYTGQPYVEINGNVPFFEQADLTTEAFESYSSLDWLGRCGVAYANVSRELMPTEERGAIGSIKPTGWVQKKYEGIIDSKPPYLYNRCHLIAYCLTAENANEENLITGTRYMNVQGMLPFEEKVARYLDRYNNHVLYRVTPVFEGDNLVASGVLMEAYSVEDKGQGICFCVYCYNVQLGIEIDYRTGESSVI